MAKINKKKQAAVPYEFIQEVNKMSKDEIVKRFLLEEDDLNPTTAHSLISVFSSDARCKHGDFSVEST